MKRIMIVQSIPEWLAAFKQVIEESFPQLKKNVNYTRSFDQAIDFTPKKGELIVISSRMFHGRSLNYRIRHKLEIVDSEKVGEKLAEIIKGINPKARLYIFSEFEPAENEFVDGFIQKRHHGKIYEHDIVSVLNGI